MTAEVRGGVHASNRDHHRRSARGRPSRSLWLPGERRQRAARLVGVRHGQHARRPRVVGHRGAHAPGSAYVDYAVYRTKPAAYAGRRVALFFWASWCPICQGDDSYIRGTIASGDFPRDLTIVKTNYDVETGLEQKYGVTSHATFVMVDSSGKALSRPIVPETVLDILTLHA